MGCIYHGSDYLRRYFQFNLYDFLKYITRQVLYIFRLTKFFILISFLFVSNTYAKWLFIGEDNGISYWYDSDVVKKKNIVDIWVLSNLPIKNKYGDRSSLGNIRIDCSSLIHKTLSNYSHSQPMAQGKPRSSNTTPDKIWIKIPITSYMMTIAEEVCK